MPSPASRAYLVWLIAAVLLAASVFPARAQDRDFTPVTDAVLQNPDPADWLNWRRTLDGWGYSPLDQVDRGNVGDLRLVWSWGLEPGVSQTTPIVHDGVMYIANPGNVVQALDARTGDFIWEYRREMDERLRPAAQMRSLAIYEDLIILNTVDAHVVGLDARTGEERWDTDVAPDQDGFGFSSGPVIADGTVVAGLRGCERFPGGHLLHRRGRRRHGAAAVAHVDHRPAGRARRRHLGRPPAAVPGRQRRLDSGRLRSGQPARLLRHRAGQAVVAGRPRDGRRRTVQQFHTGSRSRNRRDALVLPAHPRRQPRHGRDLRADPDRLRRPAVGVQHGQARHPVGARPHDRRVHEGRRSRLPEPGRRRPADRRVHLPRGHGLGRGRDALLLPEHRRIQGPAGDGVPPGHRRAVRAAQPAVRDRGLRDRWSSGPAAGGTGGVRGRAESLPPGCARPARRVPGGSTSEPARRCGSTGSRSRTTRRR